MEHAIILSWQQTRFLKKKWPLFYNVLCCFFSTIKIKVHDNGILGIFDGLVNIVVKALQKTFQEKIMATLGKQLKGLVQEKLNEIPPFWTPPPPAGNSTGRSVDLLNVFQRS